MQGNGFFQQKRSQLINEKEFVIEIRNRKEIIAEINADLRKIATGTKEQETEERVYFETVEAANLYPHPKSAASQECSR